MYIWHNFSGGGSSLYRYQFYRGGTSSRAIVVVSDVVSYIVRQCYNGMYSARATDMDANTEIKTDVRNATSVKFRREIFLENPEWTPITDGTINAFGRVRQTHSVTIIRDSQHPGEMIACVKSDSAGRLTEYKEPSEDSLPGVLYEEDKICRKETVPKINIWPEIYPPEVYNFGLFNDESRWPLVTWPTDTIIAH